MSMRQNYWTLDPHLLCFRRSFRNAVLTRNFDQLTSTNIHSSCSSYLIPKVLYSWSAFGGAAKSFHVAGWCRSHRPKDLRHHFEVAGILCIKWDSSWHQTATTNNPFRNNATLQKAPALPSSSGATRRRLVFGPRKRAEICYKKTAKFASHWWSEAVYQRSENVRKDYSKVELQMLLNGGWESRNHLECLIADDGEDDNDDDCTQIVMLKGIKIRNDQDKFGSVVCRDTFVCEDKKVPLQVRILWDNWI